MLFLCVLFLIATSCLQTVSSCQRSDDIITNQPVYSLHCRFSSIFAQILNISKEQKHAHVNTASEDSLYTVYIAATLESIILLSWYPVCVLFPIMAV